MDDENENRRKKRKRTYDSLPWIAIGAVAAAFPNLLNGNDPEDDGNDYGPAPHAFRVRRTIISIYREMGPAHWRRSYRMDIEAFHHLHSILEPYMDINDNLPNQRSINNAKNGRITSDIRLSVAIRYFAGGSPDDISLVHGISPTEVMRSVWLIVDAVNECEELKFSFPIDYEDQKIMVAEFKTCSPIANFDCCVAAIDGMLVWIHKPAPWMSDFVDIGASRFFCGRKHKFGLNLQASCDAFGKFVDIDISNPASTSDYLSFKNSELFDKLETPGFLAPGLCFFGDNAYVNTTYMAVPFRGVSCGAKDAYNFYQSQLRIKIECAFGMLVHRWKILRGPLPMGITIIKAGALVRCLCSLHNFCIDRVGLRNHISMATLNQFIASLPDEIDYENNLTNDENERDENNATTADQVIRNIDHIGNDVDDEPDNLHFENQNNQNGRRLNPTFPSTKLLRKVEFFGLERPSP